MTTWGKLRDTVVRAMAQYINRAAADYSAAQLDDTTIYAQLTFEYRRLVDEVAQRQPRLVATTLDFTYSANATREDVTDVPTTVSASLRNRTILDVARVNGTDVWPLRALQHDEYRRLLEQQGNQSAVVVDGWAAYYVEGPYMHVLPVPTENLTLRVTYVPEVSDLTAPVDGAGGDINNSPTLLPSEHHELIALQAALALIAETHEPTKALLQRQSLAYSSFINWAAGAARGGPRRVRSVD